VTERTTRAWKFVLAAAGTAVVLSVAYFPTFFSGVTSYDDEGSLLVTVRQFVHHGSLYHHTHGGYGPFYFSFAGLIFRLTGQDPTLLGGRLIVVVFTAASAALFGAAVWRVTRSIAFALLAQVTTYCVLARVAGSEPMHPGSMVVLVLSLLTFALACNAMAPSTTALVCVGLAAGALMMIKINVGLFAVVAIVIAFLIGNAQIPKVLRVLAGAAAVLLPFVLMNHLIDQAAIVEFAVLVSVGLLATYATLTTDVISLPWRGLLLAAGGALAAIFASCLWPLATGTSPVALFRGVVIQPLTQVDDYAQIIVPPRFELLAFALTVCVVFAVLARRDSADAAARVSRWVFDAGLGFAGVSVLGLVLFGGFVAWLPVIAVLPALVYFADHPPAVRLAFRFLVPLAILQSLHAYPIAGSQIAWARVAVCVPCCVAIAIAVNRFPTWQVAQPALRALAVGALGLMLVVVAGFLPMGVWHKYDRYVALKLPGARLVHVAASEAKVLHELTATVKAHCDTLYSAPLLGSLYIYSGLPTPTGLLPDGPGALDTKEQRELASQLAALRRSGKRVCIVRDTQRTQQWLDSSYGKGPLGEALTRYTRRIAEVGKYTVSVSNFAGRS
jgi:hypothetical protein